jgi:hypothetical protein
MKDEEGKTLWLDNQSHASSSVSSSDDDVSWQWPTSFWTQFKVWSMFQNNLHKEMKAKII